MSSSDSAPGQRHSGSHTFEQRGDGFDLLRAEFSKPQFMTTTGSQTEDGRPRFTVEFTFIGDGARNRAYDLQDAFMAAGRAVNGPAPSVVDGGGR